MKRNNLITELEIKIYCQNKALDIDEIKKELKNNGVIIREKKDNNEVGFISRLIYMP